MGTVDSMVDSVAASIAAVNGIGLRGIIGEDGVGPKDLADGVSKPSKTSCVGRSAKTEVGCCFFDVEEERVDIASFWIPTSLTFSC